MPGFGDEGFGTGPFGLTDYGNLSLAKQMPPIYLQKDADIPGRPFLNFLEAMAVMVRSEKEFSDRFPLLQDPLAIRAEFLGLLGDNIGAFVQVEDADIIKRNEVLHAHTWFTTKELKAAYIAIARMNGLDAIIDEVFEVPCGSGNFVIIPSHEFQFPPGLPPNAGTFPQDPIQALPGTSPPFPLPGDDFIADFTGPAVPLDDPPWETITAGAGTASRNGGGQFNIAVPAVGDAAFVRLRDNYDRRAKFDTIVQLDGIPLGSQLGPDTAFIVAVLQPPPTNDPALIAAGGNLGPKAHDAAILDRRVTAEADRVNGGFYLRVTTNLGPGGTPADYYWDQTNQRWSTAKVVAAALSPVHTPYKFILRTHSQWFKWVVIQDTGLVVADTKPFFWSDVLNNGMPMSLVMGDTSDDTGRFTQLLYGGFESAFTEDCDYAKVSALQVQFFIPAPGSGAGTYFPPFSTSLPTPAQLATVLANIRRKFAKVTPIHLRLKYPTQLLAAAVRFFQHFDVNDLAITVPLTAADLLANPNVDPAFTSADSHPTDASPTLPFNAPPWPPGTPAVYKEGQDGGWVQAEVVAPTSDALHAVITSIGKQRLAEMLAGVVSGAFIGGTDQSVRPTHFVVGTGGKTPNGGARPPDETRTNVEAAVPGRLQKVLIGPVGLGNDINVSLPPFSAEATVEFKLTLTAAENAIGAGQTLTEVGVFVQFGGNPPEMFLYGTFPPIAADGTTAVDFRLRARI
jgi:hypothetical protein